MKEKDKILISNAEWQIMHILWDESPLMAAQIFERLPQENDWKRKTLNTFLKRLIDKGMVSIEKVGAFNGYISVFSREECIGAESKNFLERVLQGAAKPLFVHLLANTKLSKEDIKELENLIRKKKKKL